MLPFTSSPAFSKPSGVPATEPGLITSSNPYSPFFVPAVGLATIPRRSDTYRMYPFCETYSVLGPDTPILPASHFRRLLTSNSTRFSTPPMLQFVVTR